ncbi:sphingomyelin phosphodiesterase 5-like [Gastrophryne carolinensis]
MSIPESPYCCTLLQTLLSLGSALVFPSFWFIDRLLSCVVPTSEERSRSPALRLLLPLVGVPFFLLLFLLSLPLCLLGFLLWAPLQGARRPFSYQRRGSGGGGAHRRAAVGEELTFTIVSANLCLLPDGLARFSNLSHTQRRASTIAHLLCSTQTNCHHTAGACRPEDVLPMVNLSISGPFQVSPSFPEDPDFICLQEVFDGRASRKLRLCLGDTFPHILYDVGPCGPHDCGFKFFNSGLFLASRHPPMAAQYYYYPNARGEDALAAKGLLCVKVQVGVTEGKQRIVGYINCTHLHAPESDAGVRCDQMSLLLRWTSDFQGQHRDADEVVAFDVLCGDLNFDNCSTDDCLEQKHELFSAYRDPCRDSAGQDRLGTVGTLLRADTLYHEALSTPLTMKRMLESEADRKLYLAPPLPEEKGGTGSQWTGRRIDYILYKERDAALPLTVNRFQFITRLNGLSDHIPVSLHFTVSLPEVTAL